jgi:NADP-dependent 3-hydroxy acid dehydrogenase YdfG
LERFLEVFMTKDLLQVPHEYHRDSGTHTRFGLIVGAGAAGLAYAKALRQRPGHDWRVSLTRRDSKAARKLREHLAREGWYGHGLAVYPLDPTDEQSVVHLGRTVIGFGKINLLVLASGQAILDSACSGEEEYYHENMAANYVTKVAAFRALQSAGCLASDAQVLVVSSRVLDFAKNAPEVSGQQGYRTSIAALEGWVHNEAKSQGCQSMFHICRMPLIVSPTADMYLRKGVVPAGYPLVDPLQYAAAELEKIFGAPKP